MNATVLHVPGNVSTPLDPSGAPVIPGMNSRAKPSVQVRISKILKIVLEKPYMKAWVVPQCTPILQANDF